MAYLRLLFWLKWKLMWRGYRRSTAALGIVVAEGKHDCLIETA